MSHRAANVTSTAAALLVAAVALLLPAPTPVRAQAQSLDLGTIGQLLGEIERFRGSSGVALPGRQSPVQQAPAQAPQTSGSPTGDNAATTTPQNDSGRRGLDPAELAAVREACRKPYDRPLSESDLNVLYNFSRIEEDYCRRVGEVMFQFGYDMFAGGAGTQDVPVGAISADYVLGIGDALTIVYTGQEAAAYGLYIDREGTLTVPGQLPIPAAGRTLGEFRRELEARTAATKVGTDVYISLSEIRTVATYVLGEVEKPGRKQLTALSSIIDAIAIAGGVKKSGSLRRIQVQRGDTIFWFDTYDLLFSGVATHDLTLRDGDRIVVPPLGDTVAIGGDVKRPGIYELAEGERSLRLRQVLDLAGGTLRPAGNRFLLVHFDETGAERLVQQPDLQQPVRNGEILLVARTQDVRLGVVDLVGHVRVPGRRSLATASTLSRLVGDANLFRENPYLPFAALETTDPQTQARRLFPVSLQAVLEGRQDYSLRDGDRLIVLGAEDVGYLSSREVIRTVAAGGKPERASQDDAQAANKSGTATDPSELARRALASLGGQGGSTESGTTATGTGPVSTTTLEVRRSVDGRLTTIDPKTNQEVPLRKVLSDESPCRGLERLAAIAATNSSERFRGIVRTLDVENALQGVTADFCPPVFNTYPDLLPLAMEHIIAVTGAVRRPGGYPVTPNTSVTAVIAVAGGLTRTVDLTRVEIGHVVPDPLQGVAADSRKLVDLATNGADQVMVGPGDVLRFNSVFTDRDKGPVVLEGEFVRPGVYDIRRGERLSELIVRAGGLTSQAYPYGAVFTRERVKEAQERDFKRAARELNSALTLAAARGDVPASALTSVQVIAAQLSSVEALGRVVTESDPTVLTVRPELDVVVEPGDRLYVPKRPSFVTVTGDVLNPGALQFISGTSADEYIRQAGGFQASADEDRVFVVYPNGVAEPVSVSAWNYNPVQIPPGSSIVVPKNPAPFDFFRFVREGSSIVSQLAVAAASLAVISNN